MSLRCKLMRFELDESRQTNDTWRLLREVKVDLVICRLDGKTRHEGDVLGRKRLSKKHLWFLKHILHYDTV
jgi:hypothetical protein